MFHVKQKILQKIGVATELAEWYNRNKYVSRETNSLNRGEKAHETGV